MEISSKHCPSQTVRARDQVKVPSSTGLHNLGNFKRLWITRLGPKQIWSGKFGGQQSAGDVHVQYVINPGAATHTLLSHCIHITTLHCQHLYYFKDRGHYWGVATVDGWQPLTCTFIWKPSWHTSRQIALLLIHWCLVMTSLRYDQSSLSVTSLSYAQLAVTSVQLVVAEEWVWPQSQPPPAFCPNLAEHLTCFFQCSDAFSTHFLLEEELLVQKRPKTALKGFPWNSSSIQFDSMVFKSSLKHLLRKLDQETWLYTGPIGITL